MYNCILYSNLINCQGNIFFSIDWHFFILHCTLRRKIKMEIFTYSYIPQIILTIYYGTINNWITRVYWTNRFWPIYSECLIFCSWIIFLRVSGITSPRVLQVDAAESVELIVGLFIPFTPPVILIPRGRMRQGVGKI